MLAVVRRGCLDIFSRLFSRVTEIQSLRVIIKPNNQPSYPYHKMYFHIEYQIVVSEQVIKVIICDLRI